MAKYPFIVNKDGVWYKAGTEVPAYIIPNNEKEEMKPLYTKTEISKMPVSELREVAKKMQIEDVDSMTGTEIKKALYSVFEV